MYRLFVAWLAGSLLAFALPAVAAQEFVVGVLPYQGARALIAEHRSLATHLRSALKQPVKIVTARNTLVFGQRMLAGDYDLALAPAHLARLAQLEQGWHPIASYQPDTQIYLVSATSAPADKRLGKGAVIAVADRAMLIVLAAQSWLANKAKLGEGDYALLETGAHSAAIQAVLDGRADYAISALAALGQVRKENLGRIRIAHEMGTVPLLVYAARSDTPPATRSTLRRALLKYSVQAPLRIVATDRQALAGMDRFLPATRLLLAGREGNPHGE